LCGSSVACDFGWECIAENQLTGKTTFAHLVPPVGEAEADLLESNAPRLPPKR
jgi:hypothetical protein